LAAENGHPRELCTTRDATGKLHSPKLQAPKIPQLIVPTTPTTAMVKAGSAVFDPDTGERLALFDPKTRAQAVFIDPQMILSSPRALNINSSINTMSMAIEGLSSRSGNPISDALLMHVLRLVTHNLPVLQDDDNADVRADLLLAAVLCGQGTDHTGVGITTVLGHAIGARHHIDNGLANAIVLAHMLRFNGTANEPGLQKVAAALELPRASVAPLVDSVVATIERLFAALGVAQRLRDVGVTREDLPQIAGKAIGDWFLGGNPRPVRNEAELLQVLEAAW
jgi:alcohol dehydrogenase class IV